MFVVGGFYVFLLINCKYLVVSAVHAGNFDDLVSIPAKISTVAVSFCISILVIIKKMERKRFCV